VILNKTNNYLSLLKPLDTKIHDMGSHIVYFCVQRFEEREVIVSFVEDHILCIFVFRGLRRER
jgi:hypothetical protein